MKENSKMRQKETKFLIYCALFISK